MTRIHQCGICGKKEIVDLISFKDQVVCHHFLKDPGDSYYSHDLVLGQCGACGTAQLTGRMPLAELKPRYDWIKCNEPEAHLDRLAEKIGRLPGVTKDSKIGGISFKDDSTLQRLNKLGFPNTWRADPRQELGISDAMIGFHAVQEHFNLEVAQRLVKAHGKADVLIARQIIEHTYDFRGFMEACKHMISPNGYIVFEIPDCERALDKGDYMMMWEEHTIYFTAGTFQNCFALSGLSLVHFERIPYSIEDNHVAIVKAGPSVDVSAQDGDFLNREISRVRKFVDGYEHTKNSFKKALAEYKRKKQRVVIFGGGHATCTFVNLYGLKDYIDFVVDDDPHMRGLFLPGSGLPILESREIYQEDVKLCILTLSTSSEEKVIKNHQGFVEQGGVFASVYPGSRWAMKI